MYHPLENSLSIHFHSYAFSLNNNIAQQKRIDRLLCQITDHLLAAAVDKFEMWSTINLDSSIWKYCSITPISLVLQKLSVIDTSLLDFQNHVTGKCGYAR